MSRRVFMQGTSVLYTLPDETEAVGRFVDRRGNKTFLYRGGAGFWLHRQDRDDPTVELQAKMIGLDDAAVWLVQHGCAVPEDIRQCLHGQIELDKDGKPSAFGRKQEASSGQPRAEHDWPALEDYVRRNPDATDVKAASDCAGIRVWHINRSAIWRSHLEAVLERYLDCHPEATLRTIERDLDIDATKASGMQAWKRFKGRARAAVPAESHLSDATLACRPDEGQSAPPDVAEHRESIFQILLDNAAEELRSRLKRMTRTQQISLVERLVSDPTLNGLEGELAIQGMLNIADSYRDDLAPKRR
jgi:hypothetical protein